MEQCYKRKTRRMPQQQREKIRQALLRFNQTHTRDDSYIQKIKDGCKRYWESLGKEDETDIEDLI